MERADGQAAGLDEIREPLQDVFHAVLGGAGGKRRLQPAGDRARVWTGAMSRSCARWRNSCARPPFPSARTIWSRRWPAIRRSPRFWSQLFHARHDPEVPCRCATRRGSAMRIEAALRDVPSLDDDRIIRRFRNVIANILRTNYYQARAPADHRRQAGFRQAGRTARAAALARNLRLFAADGRRASALRQGGARRHPLVRPARGFPHRDSGPGEGAAGQECGDRAGGRQGRLLSQDHARQSHPRAVHERSASPPTRCSSTPCSTSPTI